jgi:hypothetical protein
MFNSNTNLLATTAHAIIVVGAALALFRAFNKARSDVKTPAADSYQTRVPYGRKSILGSGRGVGVQMPDFKSDYSFATY